MNWGDTKSKKRELSLLRQVEHPNDTLLRLFPKSWRGPRVVYGYLSSNFFYLVEKENSNI